MPLEIREVAIRMRVGGGGGGEEPAACAQDDGTAKCGDGGGGSRAEIVEECVRRVLLALKATRER